MSGAVAFRGQPLLLIGGLLVGWACLRIGMLQAAWDESLQTATRAEMASSPQVVAGHDARPATLQRLAQEPHIRTLPALALALPPPLLAPSSGHLATVEPSGAETGPTGVDPPPLPARGVPDAAPSLAAARPARAPKPYGRLSADGWLLLRGDNGGPVIVAGPSYGRSQIGSVLRYDLAPGSGRRPQVYLRASAAIEGARDRQLAAGVSLRPLRGIPLRVAAEARLIEPDPGTALAAAAYAVSEFPPVELPLGVRGEAYLQGGYVTGRYATAFADGQVRVEKPLSRIGPTELSVGGGAWGGAQKGSARLDVGPGVAAIFPLGEAYGRLAVDYRFRVAGDAAPASGPALTLSAGF